MADSRGIGPGGAEPPLPPQPGRRRIWLVCGAVLAAVLIGVFVWTMPLGAAISIAGIVMVAVLFAAMIIAAIAMRRSRPRSIALAWLLCLMALGAIVLVLIQSITG